MTASVGAIVRPLGLAVTGARSGAEALAAIAATEPSLVLMAVDLPEPSAYEVLHQLRAQRSEYLPIVFLSAIPPLQRDEIAALLLGADDYLGKPVKADSFTVRIRRLLDQAAGRRAGATAVAPLTGREFEVLQLLTTGVSSADIAQSLCITKKTVATHIEHILSKLGVHSQSQAVAFALRNNLGMTDPPVVEVQPAPTSIDTAGPAPHQRDDAGVTTWHSRQARRTAPVPVTDTTRRT